LAAVRRCRARLALARPAPLRAVARATAGAGWAEAAAAGARWRGRALGWRPRRLAPAHVGGRLARLVGGSDTGWAGAGVCAGRGRRPLDRRRVRPAPLAARLARPGRTAAAGGCRWPLCGNDAGGGRRRGCRRLGGGRALPLPAERGRRRRTLAAPALAGGRRRRRAAGTVGGCAGRGVVPARRGLLALVEGGHRGGLAVAACDAGLASEGGAGRRGGRRLAARRRRQALARRSSGRGPDARPGACIALGPSLPRCRRPALGPGRGWRALAPVACGP